MSEVNFDPTSLKLIKAVDVIKSRLYDVEHKLVESFTNVAYWTLKADEKTDPEIQSTLNKEKRNLADFIILHNSLCEQFEALGGQYKEDIEDDASTDSPQ